MYKINKQQGYTVQHRKIQPLFCKNFKWKIVIIEMKVIIWGKILIAKVKQQQKQVKESYVNKNESEARESVKLEANADSLQSIHREKTNVHSKDRKLD